MLQVVQHITRKLLYIFGFSYVYPIQTHNTSNRFFPAYNNITTICTESLIYSTDVINDFHDEHICILHTNFTQTRKTAIYVPQSDSEFQYIICGSLVCRQNEFLMMCVYL